MKVRDDYSVNTDVSEQSPWRRWLITLGKVTISIASVLAILQIVSLDTFLAYLRKTNITWFVAAVTVNLLAQVVSALRFVYVAEALGGSLRFVPALRIHFIGLWFNQIFPTGFGGDVVKATMLRKSLGTSLVVRVAILDRFSGLAFMMFAVAFLLGGYQYLLGDVRITVALGVLSIGFLLATAILAVVAARRKAIRTRWGWPGKPFVIFADIYQFRWGKPLYQQVWTSLVVHINGIVGYAFLGKALGLEVDALAYVLLVPLVFLVALLPISFASWGIREIGAVSVFSWIGVPAEQALALSVLFGILMIVSSTPGLAVMNIRAVKPILNAK